ncbi:MAG TPA: BrnT family toxin [Stellaceae bacterium]|nr:BrnT family toxin [Stellaceae bacterium]
MAFEWDEAKRLANIRKHGIDFTDVEQVFTGSFVETEDLRRDYGEKRFRAVGRLGAHIVQVAYTWRGDRRRIISARRAGRNDRRTYYARYAGAGQENEKPD